MISSSPCRASSSSLADANGNGIRYQGIIYSNAYHGMGVYPKPSPGGGKH